MGCGSSAQKQPQAIAPVSGGGATAAAPAPAQQPQAVPHESKPQYSAVHAQSPAKVTAPAPGPPDPVPISATPAEKEATGVSKDASEAVTSDAHAQQQSDNKVSNPKEAGEGQEENPPAASSHAEEMPAFLPSDLQTSITAELPSQRAQSEPKNAEVPEKEDVPNLSLDTVFGHHVQHSATVFGAELSAAADWMPEYVAENVLPPQHLEMTQSSRGTRTSMANLLQKQKTVRKVKILCTMGPKCWDEDMLGKLIDAGMNIARFNFSHGSHEAHFEVLERFRKVVAAKKSTTACLLDTKGPEIRTAMLKDHTNIKLEKGQDIFVEAVGDAYDKWEGYKNETETRIGLSYAKLCQSVSVGNRILLADGSIVIEVMEIVSGTVLRGTVLNEKELGERKNCNLPGVKVDIPVLTDKDINDLQNFCVKHKMDYVAASFVQSADDVRFIRKILDDAGGKAVKIISKIENEAGLTNIDGIIAETDGIMVARGDLGMEIPSEKVALAQKMIITKCNVAGKFVITATQMLESMIANPLPTRAEMTDVANAVFDGTDCVMLSGETANGSFPNKAVEIMSAIAANAELGLDYYSQFLFIRFWNYHTRTISPREAICASAAKSAVEFSEDLDGNGVIDSDEGALVIVVTRDGSAANMISKYRPTGVIMVVTDNEETARGTNSWFGQYPFLIDSLDKNEDGQDMPMEALIMRAVVWGTQQGHIKQGKKIIFVTGAVEASADKHPHVSVEASVPSTFFRRVASVYTNPATLNYIKSVITTSIDSTLLAKPAESVRSTKIICTMGPKCWDEDMLGKLIDAGMNIARFNFSHGSHEAHFEVLERFRKVVAAKKSDTACLLDTKGPEIRTAMLKDHKSIMLEKGQDIFVEAVGDAYDKWEGYKNETETRIGLSYAKLCDAMVPGNLILIADGSIVIEVKEIVSDTVLRGIVLNEKELGERKNCNLPGVLVDIPVLTDKDINDLQNFCVKHNMDYVAASFVQSGADVDFIRAVLDEAGGHNVKIISKIENEAGLANIDQIIFKSDGIMVARGDLGMEIPSERVAAAQKMIITKCNVAGKFVITATQMLESMVKNPLPTRAEMTDVANAVIDGTDCVMLSGETANGSFPASAVATMSAIAANAEVGINKYDVYNFIRNWTPKPMNFRETICSAAVQASFDMHACLITIFTDDLTTARLISKWRPHVPVIVVTRSDNLLRHTNSHYGLVPMKVDKVTSVQEMMPLVAKFAKDRNLANLTAGDNKGDQIIVVSGAGMKMIGYKLEMSCFVFGDEMNEIVLPTAYAGNHTLTQKSCKVGMDLICEPTFSVRKTKIICTMGPKCWDEDMLGKLIDAGMNTARFNFSHGSHEAHFEVLERFRKVVAAKKSDTACLLDTKGPEIRTAMLKDHTNIKLEKGQDIFVEAVGDAYDKWEGYKNETETRIGLSYAKLCQSVSVGNRILLADGSIVIEVMEIVSGTVLRGTVLNEKELGERKNCNLPGVKVDIPVLTDKDINDLQNFCVKHKMDYVAASFVQSADDVRFIRKILDDAGGKAVKIISKIENEAGLTNIDGIIAETDGIMVARGDLGMEIPSEKVALAQKMIITKCNVAGKFVITATQMLESMIANPLPTRAEMTDVANAVFDGTDCVMLSGETANGSHSVKSVETMASIVQNAEVGVNYYQVGCFVRDFTKKPMGSLEAVLCCVAKNAVDINAGLIVCFSENGLAPRIIAKYRPCVPVIVVSSSDQVIRHCNSTFSLIPYKIPAPLADHDKRRELTAHILHEKVTDKTCPPGTMVIVIKGVNTVEADVQPSLCLEVATGDREGSFSLVHRDQGYRAVHDRTKTISIRCSAISMDEVISSYVPVRKTKLICTMGPKCWDEATLGAMMDAGMNIARFNFAHGSHEEHVGVLQRFRKVLEDKSSPAGGPYCATMLDTKGPSIRTAMLKGHTAIKLDKGQDIVIEAVGADFDKWEGHKNETETRIGVSYELLCKSVKPGNQILIGYGTITIEVKEIVSDTVLKGTVINGGELGEHKNVNLPGVKVDIPVLSDRDIHDLKDFCVKHKMDYVAVSFVQSADDVKFVRRILQEAGGQNVQIISKIENEAGLAHLDDIVRESDGVMVARGDLGSEIPSEKVALAQKMIITKCNIAGKFVITATQMLESMVKNPLPTRAEMTDVANAVFDGTDCVMLGSETASGAFPASAAATMSAIAANAELVNNYYAMFSFIRDFSSKPFSPEESIASSAARACIDCKAVLCIVVSKDGEDGAWLISKYKPSVPVVVVTDSRTVAIRCSSRFGLYPCLIQGGDDEPSPLESNKSFIAGGSVEKGYRYAKRMDLIPEGGGQCVVVAQDAVGRLGISFLHVQRRMSTTSSISSSFTNNALEL